LEHTAENVEAISIDFTSGPAQTKDVIPYYRSRLFSLSEPKNDGQSSQDKSKWMTQELAA
jgi:hypothetical protein